MHVCIRPFRYAHPRATFRYAHLRATEGCTRVHAKRTPHARYRKPLHKVVNRPLPDTHPTSTHQPPTHDNTCPNTQVTEKSQTTTTPPTTRPHHALQNGTLRRKQHAYSTHLTRTCAHVSCRGTPSDPGPGRHTPSHEL